MGSLFSAVKLAALLYKYNFPSLGQLCFMILSLHWSCQATYRKKLKISKLACMGTRKCVILQSFDFPAQAKAGLVSI